MTTLILTPFDTAPGDTTFADSSGNGFTVTCAGTAVGATTSVFGGDSALRLDGTNECYASAQINSSTLFNAPAGTGRCYIEIEFACEDPSRTQALFSIGGTYFNITSVGADVIFNWSGVTQTAPIFKDRPYKLGIGQNGTMTYVVFNGVLVTSEAKTYGVSSANQIFIGRHPSYPSNNFKGFINSFKFVKDEPPPTQVFPTASLIQGVSPIVKLSRGTGKAISLATPIVLPPLQEYLATKIKNVSTVNRNMMQYAGVGRIFGTLTADQIPVSRFMRLYDHKYTFIDQVLSGEDGRYEFTGLNTKLQYMIIAYDYENTFSAIIADRIYPIP